MTNETTIFSAAKAHLLTMSGLPAVVLPNEAEDVTLPRLEVLIGPTAGVTYDLGGATDTDLMLQITVVEKAGNYTAQSDVLVQAVVDHFKIGTAIDKAQVSQRPTVAAPLQDEVEYRVPITIRLRAMI